MTIHNKTERGNLREIDHRDWGQEKENPALRKPKSDYLGILSNAA